MCGSVIRAELDSKRVTATHVGTRSVFEWANLNLTAELTGSDGRGGTHPLSLNLGAHERGVLCRDHHAGGQSAFGERHFALPLLLGSDFHSVSGAFPKADLSFAQGPP